MTELTEGLVVSHSQLGIGKIIETKDGHPVVAFLKHYPSLVMKPDYLKVVNAGFLLTVDLSEKIIEDKLTDIKMLQIRDSKWKYDSYVHGMNNGIELVLAILEGRLPEYQKGLQPSDSIDIKMSFKETVE